jgi:chromosome segregation ATPase
MDTDPFQIPTAAELRDGLRSDIESLRAEVEHLKNDAALGRHVIDSLRSEICDARRYIDGQDLRSDYRTAGEMRAALDAARDENKRWHDDCIGYVNTLTETRRELDAARADVVRLTAEVEAVTDLAEQRRNRAKQAEFARDTATARASVLEAEVRDARAWHDTDARSTGQMMELATNWDKSRANTDSTHALDAGKFRVGTNGGSE